MHILEIMLLVVGTLVGAVGLYTLIRAGRYAKPTSFRRFDDL